MQRIVPFLWFDGNAEEAVNFYVSVFEDSRIVNVSRYGEAGPEPVGTVMTISFELRGVAFTALNGGTEFKFTPAISFLVECQTQQEVDRLWDTLGEGGAPMACGWLTDKYGVSWQIVPARLLEMVQDPDPAKSQPVMRAMMGMIKLDLEALEKAYSG